MADPITDPNPPAERPNLGKRDVAMSTAIGTAIGAVGGLGISTVLERLINKDVKSFSEVFKNPSSRYTVILTTLAGAAIEGTRHHAAAKAHNAIVDKTQPYIERLEQERADAKSAMQKGMAALSK